MSRKIRLEAVGHFSDEGTDVNETSFDRPVMLVYSGNFDSMDGPVEITPEHIALLCANHNSMLSKVKRMTSGEIPMREYPPLQLDHSTSATHTIGRLVGNLTVGEAEIAGAKKPALFGVARFLGKENVEKAKDGRYTHVSIGADLESGKLNELSVTPFPAAPHAALLAKPIEEKNMAQLKRYKYKIEYKGKSQTVEIDASTEDLAEDKAFTWADSNWGVKSSDKEDVSIYKISMSKLGEENKMHEKLKKHLMEDKKMSEKEAEELSKKMTDHHMKHLGIDEEKMSKHLEAADDKEMSRMSEDYDAHCKKLAAEETKKDEDKKEDDKKMSAAKEGFTRLAKDMASSQSSLVKNFRLSAITARVARLRSSAKITPAEIKKLDMQKLSTMTEGECEAALSTFDLREPMIKFNHVSGTTKALQIDAVAKKYRMARLEIESRLNMPSKRAEAETMLSRLTEEEKKEMAAAKEEGEVTKGMLHKMTFDTLCKMMDDSKQHEELKKHLKHLVEHYHASEGKPEEGDEKRMSALAKSYADLQNKFNELVTVVSPALGIKPEDLK